MECGYISNAEYDYWVCTKQDNDLKLIWCDIKSPTPENLGFVE